MYIYIYIYVHVYVYVYVLARRPTPGAAPGERPSGASKARSEVLCRYVLLLVDLICSSYDLYDYLCQLSISSVLLLL